MVSVVLGRSYHADLSLSGIFSDKFGCNKLFDAIKNG